MKNTKLYFLLIALILISACGGLNDKQRKSAEDAIGALKKLDAATDVGINKIEYSKMLIDALSTVNQAMEKMPDGELKQETKSAMDSFMDAKKLWNMMGEDSNISVCETQPDTTNVNTSVRDFLEIACNREGADLMKRYKIPMRPYPNSDEIKKGQGVIIKKEGVSIIWNSAKEHIKRASTLMNETK
ncbi:MAG TPA: hypothetical protein VGC76_14115 [Pyrinomonadaceae bacterium]|jgi:hypothetical protein